MRCTIKLAALTIAAAFLAMTAVTPSQAKIHKYRAPANYYAPQYNPYRYYAPRYYSPYRNPDGTYNSAADFSRERWGVPCGINCTREAQERWERYYTAHPVPYGQ
jgi:hypothetical protein